jgi:hypothetical protein
MKRCTPLLALLLLAACDGGPLQPGRFTLEGDWLGRSFPYELRLELEHARDNRITGRGELRGLREELTLTVVETDPLRVDTVRDTVYASSVAVDVSGEWSFPAYTLHLSAPGLAGAAYAGGWASEAGVPLADTLAGTLQGSGFGAVALPLVRVP